MKHKCKVTVIDKKLFSELQKDYLADPESGPCPCFEVGQEYLFEREAGKDDFYHFGRELNPPFPCAEAWDAVSRYIYTTLAGGAIMKNWTNDERIMIACCNDGTRPVVFKIERIDVPENAEDEACLATYDFSCSKENAYTGQLTNRQPSSRTSAWSPLISPTPACASHREGSAKRKCHPQACECSTNARCSPPPKEGHDRSFLLRYATPSRVPLAMTSFRVPCSLSKRSLGSSESNPAA